MRLCEDGGNFQCGGRAALSERRATPALPPVGPHHPTKETDMERLLYALPLIACPVAMYLMMWFMMRGKKHEQPPQTAVPAATDAEIASLRAELDQLKADRRNREAESDQTAGPAGIRQP
jgi:hypothetical protein